MVKDSLRQRWRSSVNCLAHELLHSHNLPRSDSRPSTPSRHDAAASADAASSVSDGWLVRLASLHGEPHRAYHNMDHVEDVLASLDLLLENNTRMESMDADTATATLAAFFHDAIYDPTSSTNEKDSAGLFLEFSSELSNEGMDEDEGETKSSEAPAAPPEMESRIERCIVATAAHVSSARQARESGDALLAAFLDADMSVLGRDARGYDEYAGCIRREYQFVNRDVYCEKRAAILESFLPALDVAEGTGETSNGAASERPRVEQKRHSYIYATERGRELWEARARHNLRREINMLRRGIIPCEM